MVTTRKSLRDNVLNNICFEMDYLSKSTKNGRVPYGNVGRLLNLNKVDNPWLTRDKINFAYKKYKTGVEDNVPVAVVAEGESDPETTVQAQAEATAGIIIGRPKGTTKASKVLLKDAIIAAKNEITTLYQEEKKKSAQQHKRLTDGWLQKLIDDIKKKRCIEKSIRIPVKTIRNRVNSFVLHPGKQSLMAPVEGKLVQLVLAMARIRRCLTTSESLDLANDLIRDTPVEQQITEWKRSINLKVNENEPVLGRKYWSLFKKRWGHKLVSKRGQKFAMDRNNSLTYSNMKQMYDDVYDSMVDAGVAIKLDQPLNHHTGKLHVNYKLTHPEMCLVVDEVGANLNQKDDGHVGGQKFMCEVGAIPQMKVSTKDKHFTLMGFTSLSGEAVMCLLILTGVNEKVEVETGIDLTAPTYGDYDDDDYFDQNCGKGKMFPMGPECTFKGKRIPCMVRWSKKGSITSEILKDALKTLDHFKVFDRTNNKKPFLLLDGHGSRFELPFLQYIQDHNNPWVVCIGVPYGTSLWQVGDSKQQNGSYKIALFRAKKKLLEAKMNYMIDPLTLVPTDIVPIVNVAWDASFAKVQHSKKAIADRGWNPLNYELLNDTDIQATMTSAEIDHYKSLLKKNDHSYSNSPAGSSTQLMDSRSSIGRFSALTDDFCPNFDPKYLSQKPVDEVSFKSNLSFQSGRSKLVLESLVHHDDLMKARETIKVNKSRGDEMTQRSVDVKKLTAMYNFKNIGCRIGKDSLELKIMLTKDKQEKEEDAKKVRDKKEADKKRKTEFAIYNKINKEKKKFESKKRKYEEVVNLNLPHNKMSKSQLTSLINFKMRKSDKIHLAKLKKADLLPLWDQLKDRPDRLFSTADDNTFFQTLRPSSELEPSTAGETKTTTTTTCNSSTNEDVASM